MGEETAKGGILDSEMLQKKIRAVVRSEVGPLLSTFRGDLTEQVGARKTYEEGDVVTTHEVHELYAALAKAQAEFTTVEPDAVNPHFKSKYATLAANFAVARAALGKHGLGVTQVVTKGKGLLHCTTRLFHASGQWQQSVLTLPDPKGTAQGTGSVITYARRYALCAVLGLATGEEDDDGNAGSTSAPPNPSDRPPKRPRKPRPEDAPMPEDGPQPNQQERNLSGFMGSIGKSNEALRPFGFDTRKRVEDFLAFMGDIRFIPLINRTKEELYEVYRLFHTESYQAAMKEWQELAK